MKKRIDRRYLSEGMILHVKSVSILGSLIRGSQDKWLEYICNIKGVASNSSWGNHDGILLRHPTSREWGVGEALGGGNVFTPLSIYDNKLSLDKCFIKIYKPKLTPEEMDAAVDMWWKKVHGARYDYLAYPRLLLKCWLVNLSYSRRKWLRKVGNHAAGKRNKFWCTEGVAEAYRISGNDLYVDSNPTPMHTEMIAGELPTLRERAVVLELVVSY